jgi:DNA invertase Pin-like site-specific DNA recombinase
MSIGHAQRVRCAIYTRKSSEEGLEQAFNSLDAQREACAAYIKSQASEGWTALPDIYDDGGLSGGTLERPALQRLLAEVKAGKVDIIVVYKVDRLTRSLLDFSKLVEAFDAAGTSFVSVTQSFNTTTSMGRLTLNMLLSFAQFEREVTAERIRDKIAASKAKGMWMGGTPPLGYAPNGRSLKVVEPHAQFIRTIFDKYIALRNVRRVAEQLERDGQHSPVRTSVNGKTFGGILLSRGQIYSILKCGTYVGEVHHKGQVYPGLHDAIIARDTWDTTQAILAGNLQGARRGERAAHPAMLAGKLVDEQGEPLISTHANKPGPSGGEGGKVRYRYYTSRALHERTSDQGLRIPAREIEAVVLARLATAFEDALTLSAQARLIVPASDIASVMARSREAGAQAATRRSALFQDLVQQVRICRSGIDIDLSTSVIAQAIGAEREPDSSDVVTIHADVQLTRSGRAMRLIGNDGLAITTLPNPSLIKLVIKARRWWERLRVGDVDIKTLGEIEGVQPAYITRVLRLAFLAPGVVDAILTGAVLPGVDGTSLTATDAIDALWSEQRRRMLPAVAR